MFIGEGRGFFERGQRVNLAWHGKLTDAHVRDATLVDIARLEQAESSTEQSEGNTRSNASSVESTVGG